MVDNNSIAMDASNNLYFTRNWALNNQNGQTLHSITPAGANLNQNTNIPFFQGASLVASKFEDNMIFLRGVGQRYGTNPPYQKYTAPRTLKSVLFDDSATQVTVVNLYVYPINPHPYHVNFIQTLNRSDLSLISEVQHNAVLNEIYIDIPPGRHTVRGLSHITRDWNGNFSTLWNYGYGQGYFVDTIDKTTAAPVGPIKYLPTPAFSGNNIIVSLHRPIKSGAMWIFSEVINGTQRVYRMHKLDQNYAVISAHNIIVEQRIIAGALYQNNPVQMVIDPNEDAFYIMWELPENYPLPVTINSARVHMLVKYDSTANELWRYKFTCGSPFYGVFPNSLNYPMFENDLGGGPSVPMCISPTGEIYFCQRGTTAAFHEL